MKAATLVGIARHTPAPVLRLGTTPPARSLVLAQIFKLMPQLVSPTGRKTRGVIRFDIAAGSKVDTWYATFADGRCVTGRELPAGRPRATISLTAPDFVALATGTEPIKLFRAGKLRLAGDTYFGASVAELFELGG